MVSQGEVGLVPRKRVPAAVNPEPDALELVLRDRPSDERSGSSATLGFSFQQWWAALVVAELLGTDGDFAVGIEVLGSGFEASKLSYEPRGRGFDSCQPHHKTRVKSTA